MRYMPAETFLKARQKVLFIFVLMFVHLFIS